MYGVGARLDEQPELLFQLRGVDPAQLIAKSVGRAAAKASRTQKPAIASSVGSIFGIEIDEGAPAPPAPKASAKTKGTPKPKLASDSSR